LRAENVCAAVERTESARKVPHRGAKNRVYGDLMKRQLSVVPDQISELSDSIISLATHINAATQKLCEMICAFDEARGWERDGQCSCEQWLSLRTGMALSTAYEHVRVARKLAHLPVIDEAFANGKLS
jgi:hypothetical protein